LATRLTFRHSHNYSAESATGITIPVELTVGRKSVRLLAKLDTGADWCIFQREYGEQLGFDVTAGQPNHFRTANSEFLAFAHEVTITCFRWEFDSLVYFAASTEIQRNVLGRQGWLRQFRVALIDYDSVIHLSHYDE
jgi:hypothetical protein